MTLLVVLAALQSHTGEERHADDAAIYKLTDEVALVHTTDFFACIVDDAYDFGRVAAANALSDAYAMGGRPITALNRVGFPDATWRAPRRAISKASGEADRATSSRSATRSITARRDGYPHAIDFVARIPDEREATVTQRGGCTMKAHAFSLLLSRPLRRTLRGRLRSSRSCRSTPRRAGWRCERSAGAQGARTRARVRISEAARVSARLP